MKIKKMINCFGIVSMNGIDFSENSVIFAPNGTFKSSFFKTIKLINEKRADEIKDRLSNKKGEFDITVFGEDICLCKDNIILFEPNELISKINDPLFYSSLLLGNKIPKESSEFIELANKYEKLFSLIITEYELLNLTQDANTIDILEKVIEYYEINELEKLKSEFDSKINTNGKVSYEVLEKTNLLEKDNQVRLKMLKEKLEEKLALINEKFGYDDAKKLSAISENYFAAGHKMIIFESDNNVEIKIENYDQFTVLFES